MVGSHSVGAGNPASAGICVCSCVCGCMCVYAHVWWSEDTLGYRPHKLFISFEMDSLIGLEITD